MNRISPQTERRIIGLWFFGLSRDKIASTVNVSGSTVSRIISKLPPHLRELRLLSKELRKLNLTVAEARLGVKFLNKLSQLGVQFDDLQKYTAAIEKICSESNYKPEQVVPSAMKLVKLEQESGKPYDQAIREFETKKILIKSLKQQEQKRKQRIAEEKKKERQMIKQNRTTKKEIRYIQNLKQDFNKYSIELSDVEDLKKYLKNMEETAGNPRKFIQFTKKQGSIKQKQADLERQTETKEHELKNLERKVQTTKGLVAEYQATADAQCKAISHNKNIIETQQKEIDQNERRLTQGIAQLAQLVRVRANVEEIQHAINTAHKKRLKLRKTNKKEENLLQDKENRNNTLDSEIQKKEGQTQALELEIQERLHINNYAAQLQHGLAQLQYGLAALEKEFKDKKERIAFADVMTGFCIQQSDYDFNQFHTAVDIIKRAREDPNSPLRNWIPIMEAKTRRLAVEVFKGDLVSKIHHNEVLEEKEVWKAKALELEESNKKTENELETSQRERKNVEAIKIEFEGRSITLADLKEWITLSYNEELEKRANQKFNFAAAAVHGFSNFLFEKITKRGQGNRS